MNKIQAVIVADSIDPRGNRITSFLLTYPRFIHSELMTHRMFSRNSASCLTGDTIIYINKPSKLKEGLLVNQPMQLADIVNKWYYGDTVGRPMKKRLKTLNIRHLNEETGEFDSVKLVNCFKQGIQDVYEITLSNGYKIKCTENHRILSENGWITLSDYNFKFNGKFCSWDTLPKIATNGVVFDVNTFIKGKEDGKTLREICKEYGYLEKSASAFCLRNNISFKNIINCDNESLKYKDYDWLLARKQEGLTNSRIAELCNSTEDRIKKSCRKLKISGFTGTILKGGRKRSSWNTGKTYHLPESSLVNVRESAKRKVKEDSYKNYKTHNQAITRFLQLIRRETLEKYNYTCAISGSHKNLELHHIDPTWNNPSLSFDKNNFIIWVSVLFDMKSKKPTREEF